MSSDRHVQIDMARAMQRLLGIMRALRDPVSGCPWDQVQNFRSIAPYTLEEAYEVADAIEREDAQGLCDELGDLLFQVVFHARLAEELDWFDFTQVVTAIADKLERRHPHVFGDTQVADAATQTQAWEAHKQQERAQRGQQGVLADIPLALPALSRAAKLQKRAARLGLDWSTSDAVVAKLREEIAELEGAREQADAAAVQAEIGDLLFTCVNLARHLQVDAETALREANSKFIARVSYVERHLSTEATASAAHLDALWTAAKKAGL